jgi:PAS domain S-box-containing protein
MGEAARAGSLEAVYQGALHCVQLGLQVERASLLLVDATRTMRFVAWCGLSAEYRRAVDGHSPWSPDESGAMPVLVEDVDRDPSMATYLPIFRQEGIRALAFVPLQFGATLLGKFMLYYDEPHVFSEEEIATAEQIADYVAFALEHQRIATALEAQLVSERELRSRAEAEAGQRLKSESRLNLALNAGHMGAWELDLATDRVHWSEELERIHGIEPGTFAGTKEAILRFVHPLDSESLAQAMTSLLTSPPRDYHVEYRIVRPDGACRWLTARGRILIDDGGTPVRLVGVASDITELKRMEEAAREAERRKDDFLATLSHELRNPLAPLRTGVAVIRRATDPETVVEQCSIMERQLQQLTRLVDDLLDVAELTRRGLPLEKSRIEVSAIVRAALDQSRPLVEDAGHELLVTLPDRPIVLEADPVRIVQILTNLLSNAVKYTPRAGRIHLVAERDGSEVRLSVKDSGLGIPTDKLGTIFEMFGQLDRSLETGYKGLGIGLALVEALVSMHGGRITAASDGLGKGSEFSVWLPIAAPAEAVQPSAVECGPDARAAAGCRVLLVDDNRDVAISISRFVRQLGHDVRIAFDGAEAVQIADDFRPDVVLMDIGMPKLNGYDVAKTLRAKPWGAQLTLVAMTGWGREHDQRRSFESGFDRHMTKPVEPLALEAFLESSARTVAMR